MTDVAGDIHISVIRRLQGHPPSHYAVQITSRRPADGEWERNTYYQVTSRVHVMHPDGDLNLENFIAARRDFGSFILAPAVLDGGQADILTDLAIVKRDIPVVLAPEVRKGDVEWIALELIARQDVE